MDSPEITWEDGILRSLSFDDFYFSKKGGFEESRYVFLGPNQIEKRLRLDGDLVVGELGFGTGLNFFLTWLEWKKNNSSAKLFYFSCEKFPLDFEVIKKALSPWSEITPLLKEFERIQPMNIDGFQPLFFEDGNVVLVLMYGDAVRMWRQFSGKIDAWYLDGFSPKKNPDLWSNELLHILAEKSSPGATFSTFSSAVSVQANLRDAGFSVKKEPGFAGKREMLVGTLGAEGSWKSRKRKKIKAAVIGAGLAGCTVARSLAVTGCEVTVLDSAPAVASGASGNSVGLFAPVLTGVATSLHRFSVAGFLLLRQFLKKEADQVEFDFSGVVQTAFREKLVDRYKKAFLNLSLPSEMAATKNWGKYSAVVFPQGGWVRPKQLCERNIAHQRIQFLKSMEVEDLRRKGKGWEIVGNKGKQTVDADVVIVANAGDANLFSQTSWLPLRKIKGQVVEVEATENSLKLNEVVCYDGYITPAISGRHMIGATYRRDDFSSDIVEEDNRLMIQRANEAVGSDFPMSWKSSRVSFRAITEDVLPLVGKAPNSEVLGTTYDGLYLSLAHGSRGLIYSTVAAEIIASDVTELPQLLEQDLIEAVSPMRLLKRRARKADPRTG